MPNKNEVKWIDIEKDGEPSIGDFGKRFVVKVGGNVHILLWDYADWNSCWKKPSEWQEPTHYMHLPEDCKVSKVTMD